MLDKLEAEETGAIDKTGKGIKKPERLFDLALQFGLIEKITKDDEELYELKVYFLPETRECEWSIREDRETIIKELRLNEPLFELFCGKMIKNVELTAMEKDAKVKLFKELMPYLPPHFKGPLEEEYPAANVR